MSCSLLPGPVTRGYASKIGVKLSKRSSTGVSFVGATTEAVMVGIVGLYLKNLAMLKSLRFGLPLLSITIKSLSTPTPAVVIGRSHC